MTPRGYPSDAGAIIPSDERSRRRPVTWFWLKSTDWHFIKMSNFYFRADESGTKCGYWFRKKKGHAQLTFSFLTFYSACLFSSFHSSPSFSSVIFFSPATQKSVNRCVARDEPGAAGAATYNFTPDRFGNELHLHRKNRVEDGKNSLTDIFLRDAHSVLNIT